MPDSPRIVAQGPVEVSVESGGQAQEFDLVSITITKTLNRLPTARIVLIDGDVAEQDFPVSDSEHFKPGAEITIKAGYDGETDTIFDGVVVRHRLRIDVTHGGRLVVDCRDKAYAMTLDRKNANHVKKKDSDVITSLIGNYTGLKADVSATTVSYDEMIQYYCSDWDYMLSRAEVNGQVVIVDDATVKVTAPVVSGSAVLEVTYGEDLIEFDAGIDARTQLQEVESTAWDPAKQKMESASAKPKALNEQGDLTGATLATAAGAKEFRLQSPTPLDKASLTDWAKARQLKAGLARIQGKVTFLGNASAKPGELIDVKGVGNRFDGIVYLSRIEHHISPGEWTTHAEFGLSPEWFVETHEVTAPPASGWLPGISGLHVGVVKKLDADPKKQFRVQVTVPLLGDTAEAVWARVSRFYSSNEFGAFFIPEIGDEVVLGFLNDDPTFPVILGSLYSSKLPAPYELEAENNIKALITRSKLKLEFDDKDKVVTISTPEGNEIVFSEKDKSIKMKDQNDNKLTMNSSGISLESPKDIKIDAKGNVSIGAVGKIELTAKQDVAVKGLNVTHDAQIGFTAKGAATAELSASGQTTVKGAMVMIN